MIKSDNLHVLIYPEIGMDPMTARLASLRLAPVQCTSWGHPETSGLPTIDYFLSSDMIEPKGADEHYTEKLIRLPNLSVHYTPLEPGHAVLSRTALGLRPDSILYHCCQSLYKFLPQHDRIFPRIARKAGDCQFLFSSYPNIDPVIEKFRSRMDRAFREYEMNADDHVAFLPPLAPDHYQALNRLADVYLDTIGWSGCNSVLEALASDLPVVTMPTGLMRGREATAILTIMDIPGLIAETPDEYVELAVKLGTDRDQRRLVSEEIAKRKQAAYRDRKCISGLEDALARIVREQADSPDISVRG
jgi:predicted O-linked N-acetylglucosamine transferase (SPINDLY family)